MSKVGISALEALPAELFREIFAHLDGYHIYLAFYGLNSRLESLARLHMVKCLDLRNVKYDRCQEVNCVNF